MNPDTSAAILDLSTSYGKKSKREKEEGTDQDYLCETIPSL